jgi:hypothetical protein
MRFYFGFQVFTAVWQMILLSCVMMVRRSSWNFRSLNMEALLINNNFQRVHSNSLLLLLLLLLLFTATGLSPGGSSPTVVQTKIKIHKTSITTKQLQNIKKI